MRNQLILGFFFLVLGCTPKLQGICSSDGDCRSGETCSASGICLSSSTAGNTDGGNPDGGNPDGGNPDGGTVATVDMVAPSSGSVLGSGFHVSATTSSNSPISDVTFVVAATSDGAQLGTLVVTTPTNHDYAGNLLLDNKIFAGQASIRANLHRNGLPELQSAAVLITIDQSAPAIVNNFDGSGQWFAETSTISVTATVTDQDGIAEVDLTLPDGGSFTGTTTGQNLYTFQVPASAVAPAGSEASVSYNLVARDAAGNPGQLNNVSVLQVDDKPPVIAAASIDSAFDGTDSSGQGWFCGPTATSGTAPIVVSASISDGFLVISGSGAPAAVVGGTRIAGTFAGGRWSFALPRSIGLNATGPITVSFDAQDQAGNHPVSPPTLALQFDDVPASAFSAQIATDPNWYSLTAAASLPVKVTFGVLPRSGISSAGVVMKVQGKPDVVCTGADLSWTCALPTSYGTAGAETVLLLDVFMESVTGVGSNGTNTRNIDDAPPTISATLAIPYPTAATGPLSWSHDGSHFNLHDGGVLYAFSAFDCGAGIRAGQIVSTTPSLTVVTASLTDSGSTHACANGISAKVINIEVFGNFTNLAAGTFPGADNTLSAIVAAFDNAVDANGAPASHGATASKSGINVTRRLWQTANNGATSVAVGPLVIAAGSNFVSGLSPQSGSQVWLNNLSGTLASGPSVGGTSAATLVYYGVANSTTNQALAVSAGSGATVQTCGITPTVNAAGCGFRDTTTFGSSLAVAGDGSAAFVGTSVINGFTTNTFDVQCLREASALMHVTLAGCSASGSIGNFAVENVVAGRNSRLFLGVNTQDQSSGSDSFSMAEINVAGGTLTSGPSGCTPLVVTDNAGNDSPFCGQSRYTFNGSFALNYNSTATPDLSLPGDNLFFAGANAFLLGSGSAAFSGTTGVVALDNSAKTVAYLSNGTALSTATVNGTASFIAGPWALPALPGSITDLTMDKSGNLYVAAGGQVSAIATDSPGLASGTAWPLSRRDACRSNSLDFTCPF